MPLDTATISWTDLDAPDGVKFDGARVWAVTNIDRETVIDSTGNEITLGAARGTIDATGGGSITLPIPTPGSNPTTWQWTIYVDYHDRAPGKHSRGNVVRPFGPFTIDTAALTRTVTNKALTSNVATLTTSSAHGLAVGNSVTVAAVDSTFNGTYTVVSVPTATTFTYAKTASNVTSAAATGTAYSLSIALGVLVEEQEIPAEYLTTVTTQLEGYVDSAAASAAAAAASAAAGATSALIVASGGTVDLDDAEDDGYLIGYKVTATTTIEGTSFAPGSYIFERDSTVFGGWTYRTLDASVPVVTPALAAPSIVVGTPTQTAIPLTWAAVSGAVGYVLRVDGGVWSDLGNVTSYTITGLAAGSSYTIELAAYASVPASPGNIDTEVANTVALPSGIEFFDAANGTLLTAHALNATWVAPASAHNGVGSTVATINERHIRTAGGGAVALGNDSMITVRYALGNGAGDQIRLQGRGAGALIVLKGTGDLQKEISGAGTSIGTITSRSGLLSLRVVGTDVTVFHNGVSVATYTAGTATADKWGFYAFGGCSVFGVKVEAATSSTVPSLGWPNAVDAVITSDNFTGTDTATLVDRLTDVGQGGLAKRWFTIETGTPLGITSNVATRVGTAHGVIGLPVGGGRVSASINLVSIPTASTTQFGIRGKRANHQGYCLTISATAYTPNIAGAVSLGTPMAGDLITVTGIGDQITFTINRSGGTLVGTQTFTSSTFSENEPYVSIQAANTSTGFSYDNLKVVQK